MWECLFVIIELVLEFKLLYTIKALFIGTILMSCDIFSRKKVVVVVL